MSAGHCFFKPNTVTPIPVDKIKVLAGTTKFDVNAQQKLDVETVYEHPNYNHGHGFSYDFTILKLKEEIVLGPKAQKVCLPDETVEFNKGTMFVSSGWGQIESGELPLPGHLKDIALPWVPYEECKSKLMEILKYEIDSSTICAEAANSVFDYHGYHGPCSGDSGGNN